MKNKFQLYSQVQLTQALPEYQFTNGDIATIVEIISDSKNNVGYVLEFFDSNGDTLKVITVAENSVALPPEHAVVNYRPYKAA